jgi:ABC transporter substrate binding protein
MICEPVGIDCDLAHTLCRVGCPGLGGGAKPASRSCTRRGWPLAGLELARRQHTERRVPALTVVEELQVLEERGDQLQTRRPDLPVQELDLHAAPARLHHGVIEAGAHRARRGEQARILGTTFHVTDPVAEGFAKSLADPGGNLTGFGEFFADVLAKRTEVFKELVLRLGSLLVLIDPQDRAMPQQVAEVRNAATTLKLQLVEREVTRQSDVERVFRSLQPGDVQGVFVASSSLVTKFPSLVLRLAAERRLPVPGHRKEWAANALADHQAVRIVDVDIDAVHVELLDGQHAGVQVWLKVRPRDSTCIRPW